jgi:ribulose-5-phosphate 4-epimerase/fuculose-1-phosphate aldolase
MHDERLKELEKISQAVGNSPDLVQGGGGNTSVKLNDKLMAVKASGFKLNQITAKDGFVVVDYKAIKGYYENVDLNLETDYEKDSVEFAKKSIVKIEGLKELRPSVEAGFHSILKTYVIHTHAVYANILCCSKNGQELVQKIFSGKEYAFLWVPHINPGFSLTLKIQEGIRECIENCGKFPQVIFMENHGLIVNSDNCQKCIDLHSEVNESIKTYLGIKEQYPAIELKEIDEKTLISNTKYITDFFKGNKINNSYFDEVALYPDQLVYLNGAVSVDKGGNKLNINTKTGELVYKTHYQEALTIEETLLAYLYVINKIKEWGLPLKTMNEGEKDFINNWESEKYRKSLLKK